MIMSILYFLLLAVPALCMAQYSSTCSSGQNGHFRLYNTNSTTDIVDEGTVQYCYSGAWYAVCDYDWDCQEANAVCKQFGFSKAGAAIQDADEYFGEWSYIRNYYYYCYSSSSSLTSCSQYSVNWYYCRSYNDEAGVRCVETYNSTCSHNGAVRLTGGSSNNEGVLQYCYYGKWTALCHLDDEEAAVVCKQLGYTKYAEFISPEEYSWDFPTQYTGSLFTRFSCSDFATESSLSQCTLTSTSSSDCATSCQYPKAIRCHNSGECTDGEIRLVNGSIPQEGRVEVCVDGVWGSVCGNSWTKQAGFVICKQLGYLYSEPVVYSNSKYGRMSPIVYYNIQCQGWEKSFSECTKTNYLHFSCSTTAGLLCPDDCVNGKVRLVGGETAYEGTVEVCDNSLWGLISDVGWDEKDAQVVCKQLDLPYSGAYPVYNSRYGKPDRTIHYSYVLCNGEESSITSCSRVTHSLREGRKIFQEVVVAGVVCEHAPPTTHQPCLPISHVKGVDDCVNGELKLEKDGLLEYCVDGQWSFVCHLTHNETTVACRQLGHSVYTWGLPYDIESEESSTPDASLISNISCTSNELKLSQCEVNLEKSCMQYCGSLLGLHCYEPGDCVEESVRLVDGIIEQEGRVEVCINGVWGSICDIGWDKTDAHIVCQQLGYSSIEPKAFGRNQFGSSSGPLVYSDVRCGGWEENIQECSKKTHLEIQCSHTAVAGVMCSDDCSDGDVRLVGSDNAYSGAVEICYDNLWGLISSEGWGLPDANVVCHQLGHKSAEEAVTNLTFGHPNKAVHIGTVSCDGSESSIYKCRLTRYSLELGKNLTLALNGIAGVICYHHTSTSTIISTSTSTTIHTSIISTIHNSQFTTSSSVVTVPPSPPSTAPQSFGISGDHSLMVALISLVCFLILVISVLAVCYCTHKALRQRKAKHRRSPVVAFSRQLRSNPYDSVLADSDDEDFDQHPSEKTKKSAIDSSPIIKPQVKADESVDIDITFKSSDDEDPVYEECSDTKVLINN